MKKKYKKRGKRFKIKDIFISYLEKNLKDIFIVSIFFVIGIIIGILFLNKLDMLQKEQITEYISSFISNVKEYRDINEIKLLFNSVKLNIYTVFFLWFIGLSIIGIPIIYFIICFKGFCLGYSISSVVLTIGIRKGNYIYNIFIVFTKFNYNSVHFIARNKCNRST